MMKFFVLVFLLLTGCTQIPSKVAPVKHFDVNRYLGNWYEIARLDHSFEKGLTHVSAQYSINGNGSIKVINRGYLKSKEKWKEATGVAYFIRAKDEGLLKVSFFRPFYGTYAIFDLDQDNYSYALVSGPNLSYLWLLSRTPTISDEVKEKLLAKARLAGFNTDSLVFVDQK
jgi:apolipoprotein D and lipocalin family protein